MQFEKKISVIVPVYNSENTLERCLDSIVNQSYKNIEIIIVNDGSKDNSLKICEDYSNKFENIKGINKINEGVSYARRDGINAAQGEYVGFVDSDDFIDEHMYEKMINMMEKTDSDIAMCGFRYIYKGSKEKISTIKKARCFDRKESLINILSGNLTWNMWDKLIKIDKIKNAGFTKRGIGEEMNVILEAVMKTNRIVHVGECFYNYDNRNESATRTTVFSKKFFGPIEASLDIINMVKNEDEEVKEVAKAVYYNSLLGALCRLIRSSNEKQFYNDEMDMVRIIKDNFSHILSNRKIKIDHKLMTLSLFFSTDITKKIYNFIYSFC